MFYHIDDISILIELKLQFERKNQIDVNVVK